MSDVIYNISSGFFDSVNGDRLYSAADMNKPYKRVIADGIFPTPQGTPSTDFQVVAVSGMSVAVLAGNAMIGSRWAENSDDVGITIAGNSSSSPRIDSIFLHIDTGMDTRAAGVVYRQGTAAGTPTAPAMVQTDNITELRLADILVAPSASIITQTNITDQRGGSDCPWVAGLIQQVDTSALFDQYRAAYAEQQQDQANEWNTFMDHLARDYDISMSLRKHESTYTSTAAASLIPINIDGYDTTKDLLQVYINGIFAVEGTHYIVKSAAQIQLTNAISAGQKVHFVIYKAVMGGAQPIIPTDEQVQDAVDAYMDAHPGALVVDPELSDTSTHAIQNKAVTEAIENVNGRLDQQGEDITELQEREGDGLSDDAKNAILACFRSIPISSALYDDLYVALYPPVSLKSISATYNQSGTVYETYELSELTKDLTVTALWSDNSKTMLNASQYVLSGSLVAGISEITVSYGEKTTTFTVNVTSLEYHVVTLDDVSVGNYDQIRGKTYMKVNSWNTDAEALYLPNLHSGNYDCAYMSLPTTAKYVKFASDAKVGNLTLTDGALRKLFDVPAITTGLQITSCSNLEDITSNDTLSVSTLRFEGCSKLKSIPKSLISGYTGNALQNTFKGCSALDMDLSDTAIPSSVTNMFNIFASSSIRKTPRITSETINNAYNFIAGCNNIEEVGLDSMAFDVTSKSDIYTTAPHSFDLKLALASASYSSLRTVAAGSADNGTPHLFHMIPNNVQDVMRSIVCWGDSLTHYGDANHGNMPAQLLGMMASNVAVYNNAFFGAIANPNASDHNFKGFFNSKSKFYGEIAVIWLGTNDMHLNDSPSTIAGYLEDSYISSLTTNKYIVLNPWPERTCTEEFASRFGDHFLDIQAYTIANWETITGLTPTAEDDAAIAQGNVPPAILSDSTHINSYGGKVVATAIKDKLLALGYITADWLGGTT